MAQSLHRRPSKYFEPFAGGGAVFFGLEARGAIQHATLNDLNPVLAEAYEVIRDDVEALISGLGDLAESYLRKDESDRALVYYHVRSQAPPSAVERAARLIFLNRTCFNGLFRVNRKGEFNVPHGDYANPRILDASGLREAARSLRHTTVHSLDFERICEMAAAGDFVYLDPPYQPLSRTANFTSYTDRSFGFDDQERLARCVRTLAGRGVDVMVSNSAHPVVETLYADFFLRKVRMARAINSAGDGRAPVDELLITSWNTERLLQFEPEVQTQPNLQIA